MITYQVIYRLPDEDKHWFFIKADCDEDAAYEALDWTKTRKYNLIDVRENLMKKKYFPNNWRAIKDTPDKFFMSMPYEQFTDWKIHGYDIPDSVYSIIRTQDKDGKVEEFYYSTQHHTKKRISKSIKENKEIYLCTMEGMYHLKPEDLPIDFNNEHKNI